jgi:hypothetical protein
MPIARMPSVTDQKAHSHSTSGMPNDPPCADRHHQGVAEEAGQDDRLDRYTPEDDVM